MAFLCSILLVLMTTVFQQNDMLKKNVIFADTKCPAQNLSPCAYKNLLMPLKLLKNYGKKWDSPLTGTPFIQQYLMIHVKFHKNLSLNCSKKIIFIANKNLLSIAPPVALPLHKQNLMIKNYHHSLMISFLRTAMETT